VDACEQFLTVEHPSLLRAAFLLTGDRTSAQDLAQETAVRVLMHWRKVQKADSPQSYTRKMMLNVFLGGRRRAWNAEEPHAEPPAPTTESAPYESVDQRDALRRALRALPPRQRAAVVLRHWEDRSEAETALLLGCSVGTVKSLTSRGLAQLRAPVSGGQAHVHEGTPKT
jgi:RNA polymerase sigma-70 factor (sigma-E family)